MSGASVMAFSGSGELSFGASAPAAGKYALWLRLLREPGSSSHIGLSVDGEKRDLRFTSMIGFTDWTASNRAHAKMFAHYGEAYGHWNWFRVPDVELTAGSHQIALSCSSGASVDAVSAGTPQEHDRRSVAIGIAHSR